MGKKKDSAGAMSPTEVPAYAYEMAKFLKTNLPEKSTSLLGHKVKYFIGRKAVDALMDSKLKRKLQIQSRSQAVAKMEELLVHKFFHRAQKIAMEGKPKKKHEDDGTANDTESNVTNRLSSPQKKSKKKFKLDIHHEQIFVDSNEPYVWLYDPIPFKTWVLGGLFVVAAIAICMFPLWPRRMRDGVYYLSVAAAVFLGVILALAVVRQILFVVIFVLTTGRHKLWILPNLTEDCGFFESFVPLYTYEYSEQGLQGGKADSKNPRKDKKKLKDSTKGATASTSDSKSENKTKSDDDSDFEILDASEGSKEQ